MITLMWHTESVVRKAAAINKPKYSEQTLKEIRERVATLNANRPS